MKVVWSLVRGGSMATFLACGLSPSPEQEVTIPPPTRVPQHSVAEFLGTTSFRGASFSPDGSRVLVSSDASGVFNAYEIPFDGGPPHQLTESEESVFVVGYFPNDERFLYTSDVGGNELTHLYVRELDGSTTDLTPGRGHKATFLGWDRDGRSFYVGSSERDVRFFDVYEYSTDDYERARIFVNDGGYEFAGISPDRRYIALNKVRSNADSDIYIYDRGTGRLRHVTPHQGEARYVARFFGPGGRSLFYSTDEDSEFLYLMRVDLRTEERTVVAKTDWDIVSSSLSRNQEFLVTTVNRDARLEVEIYELASMEPVPLPESLAATITALDMSADGRRVAFYATNGRMPEDLFVYDLEEPAAGARRLTRSLDHRVEPDTLVAGKVIRFPSFDGLEIPGILYKPHQASSHYPAPGIVWVHGGPGGQSRIGYDPLLQYLVNHGYVVFAVNNRGSSGYGKTFYHLDDGDHGRGDLDDCVAAKRMLAETGFVDPRRIGIMGGSYGGYMVLAALSFRPQEFRVGVDLFGISNWLRTVQNMPPWWESFRTALEAEIGDFENEEHLRSISPLFHAEHIARPLMVLQGANDPRVLQAESDDIVAAVREKGVPVEYLVFEDEGHGFLKKENRLQGYEAILRFLETHLKHGKV